MIYYVYAIKSISKNYIYVGMTNNINRRFDQHNSGKEKTTKPYKTFNIVLLEKFDSRTLARKREIYLKSGCGKEFIKNLIENSFTFSRGGGIGIRDGLKIR